MSNIEYGLMIFDELIIGTQKVPRERIVHLLSELT